MSSLFVTLLIIVGIIILISIRQIDQYQRGVVFTMGRYTKTKNPGWRLIVPVFQKMTKVDIRIRTVDVPDQEAITQDNVSLRINAVIYYKVAVVEKAILEVEDFYYAISQLAQTTMRNVVGGSPLDEVLAQRVKISENILSIIDEATDPWGIDVVSVELKDIVLPENLKRTMAKQAEAEREKRANIINSEGEVVAASNLAKAADIMTATPGALHLRTLNSINDISSDQSNTVVFAIPMEILRGISGFADVMEQKKK
ncbi:MAG TPA: slipin family protein [Patescibacteria group bacterium]|nr:slipin family protein [Patescibacteria group bacterium]